jgi:hypothetical protein
MPQWISQYLRGDLLNMSIVEATQLAKRFFHDMARPMTSRIESSIDMDVSRVLYQHPTTISGPAGGEGGGVGDDAGVAPLAGAGGPAGAGTVPAVAHMGGGGEGGASGDGGTDGAPSGDAGVAPGPISAFSMSAPAPPTKRLRLTTE